MIVASNLVSRPESKGQAMHTETTVHGQGHREIHSMVKHLENNGFEDTPFAIVAIDKDGNAQVHASKQVKGFLDERLFAARFEDAHTLSIQHNYSGSSPFSPELDSAGEISWPCHLNLMKQRQTLTSNTSNCTLPRARHQQRLSLLREPSPASSSYSRIVRGGAASDAADHRPDFKKGSMKSFRIDSKADVTAYLESRLKRLQQLAVKKIAKAWIKGICPKKQANFPYRNKQRGNEVPRIPGWWPQEQGVCRFLEPDHIKREERMQLCLHLLRLRPTPQQLRAWNNNHTEDNKTHVRCGWTAFLKELAGPDVFDDLPKEAPNRVRLRQNLLAQMYEVAAMEEQLEKDEIDGGSLYHCGEEEGEERRQVALKRSRSLSLTSSVGDDSGDDSSESVALARCIGAKKPRQSDDSALTSAGLSSEGRIEPTEKASREQSPHWDNIQDQSYSEPSVAIASAMPSNDTRASRALLQSHWTSVQPYPQHIEPSMMASDDGLASSDPPVSMMSRRRAARAQRQKFSNSIDPSRVKIETQPSMPIPQVDQVQSWRASAGHDWVDVASSFGSSRADANATSEIYSAGFQPLNFPETQRYDFPSYSEHGSGQSPQQIPCTQVYPAQNLLRTEVCLPPNCCAQIEPAAAPTPIPMSFGSFSFAAGLETTSIGLQQPWQVQASPARHTQQRDGVPGFFYSWPTSAWDSRC
ncbi:uncharacterized protein RCC_03736 [Ramularia collo-cygni]|uniref:Subtelomeric hrmA-associated cluster protein AFUB-079030/YDR124W-like helical bundle domain-containing protein n=1 Tax=Ramularia collo-cygni TaxID=112498 RepID=A0A2D3V8S4_9PEZI|nr:uncharacterized protein RCC_03736 [Ramularia collo-cygni]CZT17899.1 uncharacterized protein RCC_03736 [Ramularia collo-cygni]